MHARERLGEFSADDVGDVDGLEFIGVFIGVFSGVFIGVFASGVVREASLGPRAALVRAC